MFLKKLIATSRWGKLNGVQLKRLEGLSLLEVFKTSTLKPTYVNVKFHRPLRRRF